MDINCIIAAKKFGKGGSGGSGESGDGITEDRLIQILSDTGAVDFASPDGDALYTDNENKIYCL